MNIHALSSLLPALLGASKTTTPEKTEQSPVSLLEDDPATISPAARFLDLLQQLQQQDPDKFKQVVSGIADRLRQAAKKSEKDGNSSEADQINKLADQFQNAATSGELPTAQDLQQAGLSMHHRGHHYGQIGQASLLALFQPPAAETDTQNLLTSLFASSTQGS